MTIYKFGGRVLHNVKSKPLVFVLIILSAIIVFDLKRKLSITHPKLNDLADVNASSSTGHHDIQAKDLPYSWSTEHGVWTLKDRPDDSDDDDVGEAEGSSSCIWPNESCDRIINQLKLSDMVGDKIFRIFPPNDRPYPVGQELFQRDDCSVDKCHITYNHHEADALIFLNSDVNLSQRELAKRRSDQIWVAYLLESPPNTYDPKYKRRNRGNHLFNWTATYRSDSEIETPYSKFVPYSSQLENYLALKSLTNSNGDRDRFALKSQDPIIWQNLLAKKLKNFKKETKVAWFVSNCNAANNRLEYAKELSKHIQVDIFGKCGDLTCLKQNHTSCHKMVNENYKFYLAFENSNCQQYLTEKFFRNALGYNDLDHLLLPIVMGPRRQDYERLAPPNSFIHVNDFESPKDLANYLKQVASDDGLYLSYFQWKFVGQFVDTKFMCRVCAMLHQAHLKSSGRRFYSDIQSWWWSSPNDKGGPSSVKSACDGR